jgi:ATP-dependent DNA helicase RecQ
MMGHDLVRPDPARHGALRLTEAARPVLRGEAGIVLRKDTLTTGARRAAAKALVSDEDAPLLSALKAKRRALAEAARVPAYVIFTDRTLIEMAETRPGTMDEIARVSGVGATKLDRYGRAFLEVITGEAEAPAHPARRALAGREEGQVFDLLMEAAQKLQRGEDGTGKYLSVTHSTLRKIAERRPDTLDSLEGISGMGEQKVDRFGEAFLDVLRATG